MQANSFITIAEIGSGIALLRSLGGIDRKTSPDRVSATQSDIM